VAIEVKRSKYRILGLVGQGQFGRVYCAAHRKTGQLVALKELDLQRFSTHKFLRELRFLLTLQHRNIVTCQALEHIANGRYLVMEYCAGGTLRSLMEHNGPLHPAVSIQLMIDVLQGIEHAHQHNIIHCDIKPENILLSLQPEGWIARISDFGISQLSQDLKLEGTGVTGSPAYMAPERFYGQYSMSADLYAVGVILFELLVGSRPFSGSPGDLMSAHMNQKVRIPGSVLAPLQTVIFGALQKLQARRFRSAQEMVAALQAAVSECPELASRSVRPLMQPIGLAAMRPFQAVRQEHFGDRIERLVPDFTTPGLERLYRVGGTQIAGQVYGAGQLAGSRPGPEFDILPLSEPIADFIVRPQGCFAVTERSLYLLPIEMVQSASYLVADDSLPGLKRLNPLVKPQLITQFGQPSLMAIDPRGRWMATATLESGASPSVLNIRQLPQLTRCHAPISCRSARPSHLLALDARHLALFFPMPQPGLPARVTPVSSATLLQLFTRRGQAIGHWVLPVSLAQVRLCPQSYRLVAIEPQQPRSILLIDLKPLKLTRIAVEITPTLMVATAWGWVLSDAAGEILLLDQDGQSLSRLMGPASPTVITPVGQYGLLVATWAAGKSHLYTLNLAPLVTAVANPSGIPVS
jgi:serine/threonine protein kinase